ncbi:hypothetical protein FSY75_09075 [Streptomyces sp. TR1341]|uniref:hypothetical protein n=1 Tax=Streptomyces sp. TR1341 TaxID=2601266 RepID=UPI00138AB27F|nr:hypothetical protein [Streptomyces sp. TR1341]
MTSTHANDESVGLVPSGTQSVVVTIPAASGTVSTRSERLLASGHWLLAAAPLRPQAMNEWDENGAAWLRPGVLFCAVAIPAPVLHAAVGLGSPQECAGPLAEALEFGPLFYSPNGFRREGSYTALLPARVARLRDAIPGGVTLPQRALLLVPAPDVTAPVDGGGPWWVSPLDGPGLLCPPERVAALVGVGRDVLAASKGSQDA